MRTPFVGMFLSLLFASPAKCATPSVVSASSITIGVVVSTSLTFAKSVNVTTGTAIIDVWLAAGSAALQDNNSDAHNTDTPCPVRLTRSTSTSISTFSATYDVIDTDAKFVALSTTSAAIVKIVSRITLCGTVTPPPGFNTLNGCTSTGGQIVLAADAPLTPESLTHELGHYKDLRDRRTIGYERWIMWKAGLPNRNITDGMECGKYSK